ncbi:unnamed protein product, partial [Discosporangium mesarthrocarpum]
MKRMLVHVYPRTERQNGSGKTSWSRELWPIRGRGGRMQGKWTRSMLCVVGMLAVVQASFPTESDRQIIQDGSRKIRRRHARVHASIPRRDEEVSSTAKRAGHSGSVDLWDGLESDRGDIDSLASRGAKVEVLAETWAQSGEGEDEPHDWGLERGTSLAADIYSQPRRLESEEESTEEKQKDFILITIAVIASGFAMLVGLCSIRKLMEICHFRRDTTGQIRYSVSEGLPKNSIERLPQEKYRGNTRGRFRRRSPSSNHGDPATAAVTQTPPDSIGRGRGGEEDAAVLGNGSEEGAAGVHGSLSRTKSGEVCDSTSDMCAICLVEYEPGQILRVIPGCMHRFHKECIDPWLSTKAACAYCKAEIPVKRSATERLWRSVSDSVGLHLVTPTTIHFSSTRRTFTNNDVRDAMSVDSSGPADVEYVGSMVSSNSASGGGSRETGGSVEAPQGGAILVQPASAPSFTVVPRIRPGLPGPGPPEEPPGGNTLTGADRSWYSGSGSGSGSSGSGSSRVQGRVRGMSRGLVRGGSADAAGLSDMEHVGSMVSSSAVGEGSREMEGAMEASEGGAIFVQPASAPAFTMVPRPHLGLPGPLEGPPRGSLAGPGQSWYGGSGSGGGRGQGRG